MFPDQGFNRTYEGLQDRAQSLLGIRGRSGRTWPVSLRRINSPCFWRWVLRSPFVRIRRIAAAWHASVTVDSDALRKTNPALARALSDRDPLVRLFAATAVSNQRQANPDAIGPLVSLLLDPDSEMSAAAARALASSGWQALDPLVNVICGPAEASAEQRPEQSVEIRRRAIHAIRLIVNWYYGQLRRVLELEAEILTQFDTEIQTYAERLAHVLHDSDDVMRYEAAVCLAHILGDVSAFQIVVDSLAAPDSVMRRVMAEDIEDLCMRHRGCFGRVANRLGAFVTDADERVRSRIANALAHCGAEAVSVLEEALGHEDECIRIGAAEALGWLDSDLVGANWLVRARGGSVRTEGDA